MASTIPTTIGTGPAHRVLNAPLSGPSPHPPLTLVGSSFSRGTFLSLRVPARVPESSNVAASGGGGGEGAGEATAYAAASVAAVTAIIIGAIMNVGGTRTVIIHSGIIALIHRVMIAVGSHGDVAVIVRCDVGRDSPPLFAFSFPKVLEVHACWQKAFLGGSPSPSLLNAVGVGVQRHLLRGDAASDALTVEGGERERVMRKSTSAKLVPPILPASLVIDAVLDVAVSRVSMSSVVRDACSAAARAVGAGERLCAGRVGPRGARGFGRSFAPRRWRALDAQDIACAAIAEKEAALVDSAATGAIGQIPTNRKSGTTW